MAVMGWHMIDTTSRKKHFDAVLRMVDEDGSGALGLVELMNDIATHLRVNRCLSPEYRNVKDDILYTRARAELKGTRLEEALVFFTEYTYTETTRRLKLGKDGLLHIYGGWPRTTLHIPFFGKLFTSVHDTDDKECNALTYIGLNAPLYAPVPYTVFREKR